MRWRFMDRVIRFEPWTAIEGRKTISLEEYSLLEPFGRKGSFPESLVVESCVLMARWLVVVSSEFEQTCILSAIDRFGFDRETAAGSVLTLSLKVSDRQSRDVRFACSVASGVHLVGHGNMVVSLLPLNETVVGEDRRALWQELYGKTQRT